MRFTVPILVLASAFSGVSAQDNGLWAEKGTTIRVTDACGLEVAAAITASTSKTSPDTTVVKTARGTWSLTEVGDDSPSVKGAYAIKVGTNENVGDVPRYGYQMISTQRAKKYTAIIDHAQQGNQGYRYQYCSGPYDDSVAKTMTETETETETEDDDNLKCEIVQDDEGVWSKVSNPSSATINGLQVQITYNPPLTYGGAKNVKGLTVKAPIPDKKNEVASFKPVLASRNLPEDGWHKFSVIGASYLGNITLSATGANKKNCTFTFDTTPVRVRE